MYALSVLPMPFVALVPMCLVGQALSDDREVGTAKEPTTCAQL